MLRHSTPRKVANLCFAAFFCFMAIIMLLDSSLGNEIKDYSIDSVTTFFAINGVYLTNLSSILEIVIPVAYIMLAAACVISIFVAHKPQKKHPLVGAFGILAGIVIILISVWMIAVAAGVLEGYGSNQKMLICGIINTVAVFAGLAVA